jgi:cytochrome c biogenesis protein
MENKTVAVETHGGGASSVLNIFSSVRLAVFLIAALILICAAGTLIPQMKERHFYQAYYGGGANIIYLFSLNDIYHSFIFYFVTALLAMNIAVCSLRRLKARLASLRSSGGFRDFRDISGLKYASVAEDFDEGRFEALKGRLKASGYALTTGDSHAGVSGFAESGRWFFAGEQLVHLSILVIIAGTMIGNIYGYKTFFRVYPGERISLPTPRYQSVRARLERLMSEARAAGTDPHTSAAPLMKELEAISAEGGRELFGLRVNDFKTEYFEDPAPEKSPAGIAKEPSVKNWNTYFTIVDGGRDISSGVIAVNSPLFYKGVNIYQSSYYKTRDRIKSVKIRAERSPAGAGGRAVTENLEFKGAGAEASFADGKFRLKLVSFIPDFAIDPVSREIYSAGDSPGNAALKFSIMSADKAETNSVWLLEISPEFAANALKDLKYGFNLSLESIDTFEREASGLQANYDPGVVVVWLGCFLMTFGLFASFNYTHKRIWFLYERSAKKISAGGAVSKGGRDFSKEFAGLFVCAGPENGGKDRE